MSFCAIHIVINNILTSKTGRNDVYADKATLKNV